MNTRGLRRAMTANAEVHTVARFEITCHCCLDATGHPCGVLPERAGDSNHLRALYRAMMLTRAFDEKAIALQRTGRLGTYASSLGQEAVGVGIASAMIDEDVLLPSFREHGAQLVRGVSLKELLMYWGGDERGSDFAGPVSDFPVCIPVASHFPHAAGVGLALKQSGKRSAAVCIAGDGATSKGDFYEAINIAGAWALPVLFVIANNQWAISVSRAAQTKAKTLAQKAIAAGIEAKQVDGNDVIGVNAVADQALKSIRNGEGPQLIEALTYRLGDHTTADDARRYRDDELVSKHWNEEPIKRLKTYMINQGWWSNDDEHGLLTDCTREVADAAEAYLNTEPELPGAMFRHLFAGESDG